MNKIKNWDKFNETNTYTYTLLNKNEEQIEIEADDIDDANRKYRELYKKGMDPMLTHMNGELIDWNRPTANFGAMKESNGDFIPYRDSSSDKEGMSLEEKMLKMNLNINQVNLTPLQMEVVIGAMKDLTTQRKNGNWTNKIK